MKKAFILMAAIALALAAFFILRTKERLDPEVMPNQPLKEATMNTAPEKRASAVSAEITPEPEITPRDRAQSELLGTILASHNDNDLRLDTELKVLSAGTKKLFQQKYEQIPAEKRNERGTIVFLLGRNIKSESDLAFMGKVLAEPPCRSMQNCASDPPKSGDVHGDNGVEVSLAYAQLMALKGLERTLESGAGNPLFEPALAEVHKATQSPVSKVATMAREMETKYSRH